MFPQSYALILSGEIYSMQNGNALSLKMNVCVGVDVTHVSVYRFFFPLCYYNLEITIGHMQSVDLTLC